MPLTYCACAGQEEEIAQSIFVVGRKFWCCIMMNCFFPHEERKNTKKSFYVSVKTYLLVVFVVLLGNPQMHWKFAAFLEECPLPALYLQCLIFILEAWCRCMQDPNASDGLQPWQAWSSDCVCRHTQPWRLGSGLGGNHPLCNA